ncbi:hypothetical protein FPV67DRAFT_1449676 [Lyophyllum atratum]|nr:hypothetical protein FPV67DRAFT_1449676 [Lyophyllum atratum]
MSLPKRMMLGVTIICFILASFFWGAYLAGFVIQIRRILVADAFPDGAGLEAINRALFPLEETQYWTLLIAVRFLEPFHGQPQSSHGQPVQCILGPIASDEYERHPTDSLQAMDTPKEMHGFELSQKPTQVQTVLIVIVESGIVFCLLQALSLIPNFLRFPLDSPSYMVETTIVAAYTFITPMYPTLVVVMVNQQSTVVETFGLSTALQSDGGWNIEDGKPPSANSTSSTSTRYGTTPTGSLPTQETRTYLSIDGDASERNANSLDEKTYLHGNRLLSLIENVRRDKTRLRLSLQAVQKIMAELNDAIDIAQQQIDQQLATLLDMVSILRQRRNALSLVSRLPAEILCRIFELARDEDELHNTSPKMCISISQVCSAWRETAMHFQGMWNFVHYNYKLEWVKELLVRSGTGPLRVDLDAEANESMIPMVFQEAVNKRFQELNFGGFSPLEFETRCRSIFGGHAPLLETLHISFDSDHKSIMHESLFSGGTPRLRDLTLRNCPLPWNSPMLKSPLTHLILELPIEAAATTWTMSQLTAVLENLPALRELVLCNVLAPMEEASTAPGALPRRKIPLLYLEDLAIIADTFPQCTYLLDRLSLTPTPFIRLDGSFKKSQSWTVQSFVDSLSSIRNMLCLQHSVDADASPGPLRAASFISNYAYHLTFAAWSNVEPIPHLYRKPVVNLLLPGYTQDLSISGVMAALPLRGLQKIKFHHDLPQEWLQALVSLEHVHTIRIANIAHGSNILEWLAQESPAPLPTFPFHALSRLEMISCTQDSSRRTADSTFTLLQTVLRRRHRHGHGIAVLYLNECDVKEQQLLELGQFVGRVICDPWLNTAVPRYDSDESDH